MSVFNIGDIVYHTLYPNHRCVVTAVEDDQGDLQIKGTASYQRFAKASELSFTPWPAPCHERPFTEVGWWIRKDCSGCYDVLWRFNETEYGSDPKKHRIPHWPGTSWIKFLGKEIE